MRNRSSLGSKNIVGEKVRLLRPKRGLKQHELLARLQTLGMEIGSTGLSRLEGQERLVQDFELLYLCDALEISLEELLSREK